MGETEREMRRYVPRIERIVWIDGGPRCSHALLFVDDDDDQRRSSQGRQERRHRQSQDKGIIGPGPGSSLRVRPALSRHARRLTLPSLIEALPDPALVAEAAHVVASLALGSDAALHALLVAHAPRALLFALASHNEPQARAALARALRVLAASIADAVGPALWGLARTPSRELRAAAASARDALCAPEALDIYLPLLSTPSPAATAVAQLLGTLLRTPAQRSAVTNWTPSPVSPEQTTRSRRGWEKTAAATTPVVPVVAKWLATLLDAPGKNIKVRRPLSFVILFLIFAVDGRSRIICARRARSRKPHCRRIPRPKWCVNHRIYFNYY